jgi:chromosome segregation ATPase
VKPSILWAIIAFLLGAVAFGVHKSFELTQANTDLGVCVAGLEEELLETSQSLKEVQGCLKKSDFSELGLRRTIADLNTQLAKRDAGIEEYRRQIAALSEELEETRESYTSFALALQFENASMRKRLSSIAELKKAEADLLARHKQRMQKRPRSSKKESLASGVEYAQGNKGFFIKDGLSTFSGGVEIKVEAASGL